MRNLRNKYRSLKMRCIIKGLRRNGFRGWISLYKNSYQIIKLGFKIWNRSSKIILIKYLLWKQKCQNSPMIWGKASKILLPCKTSRFLLVTRARNTSRRWNRLSSGCKTCKRHQTNFNSWHPPTTVSQQTSSTANLSAKLWKLNLPSSLEIQTHQTTKKCISCRS